MDLTPTMRDPGTLTAIVTGASRGIGVTVAQRLAANGYTVATPSRDELDLSDLAAVREWSEAFEHTPDALVLNAGENLPELLADITTAHWLRTLDVNLNSAFEMIRVFGPRMAVAGRGSIAAISSCFSFQNKIWK